MSWPELDARQPFPELEAQVEAGAAQPAEVADEESSYERAIARELGGAGGEEEWRVAVAPSGSAQLVPLAGTFVADVPVVFDEWQWSTDGSVTLIVHREAGAAPDALVYVEGFSSAVEQFPSYEVGRFQYTVDPRLSTNVIYPPLIEVGVRALAQRTGFAPVDVALALQKATTRTSGVGVGYTSTPGSFTGWRWVGHSKHGLDVRLGRTSGVWGGALAQGDPSALQLLSVLARQVPELRPVADNMGEVVQGAVSGRGGALTPAWMVLGSAQKKETLGVHIAIVCERQPVCPVAAELSRLVGSIRVADGAMHTGPGGRADLLELAAESGFRVLPRDKVIEAPQMVALLQRALSRQRAEAPGASAPKLPVELPAGAPALPPGAPAPAEALRNLGAP